MQNIHAVREYLCNYYDQICIEAEATENILNIRNYSNMKQENSV